MRRLASLAKGVPTDKRRLFCSLLTDVVRHLTDVGQAPPLRECVKGLEQYKCG